MKDLKVIVACLFLVGSLSQDTETTREEYPIGDMHNCPLTASSQDAAQPLYRMDVLPGSGFDALRDIDMGPVLNYNYSLCRISNDGQYLLPNDIYLSPLRETSIEEYAEYFDHWDQYSSLTSKTISTHASRSWIFAKVSSSYSSEYTTIKSHMANDNSTVARIHVRNKLYTVHAEPRAPLHPDFKSRLFEIASYLEKNITEHAHYLAELLIRDYGTHYLSSVEAGAIIAQTDFISHRYTDEKSSDTEINKIKASASVSFFVKISVGGGFSTTTKHAQDDGYTGNRTYSKVVTIGGPPFHPNSTIDQWEAGIPGALVKIDRSGDPLHFVINSNTVPELPHQMRGAVTNIVYEAIKRYFRVNTHPGCTNSSSINFDFQANVDDGNCDGQFLNRKYTFGGTYQLCTGGESPCNQYSNPLTRDCSCPDNVNYLPVKIFSGIKRNWPFFRMVTCEAYWCVARPGADIPANSGFLFGGFYTSSTPNPLTNTMGCPQYFVPLMIGNYVSVCVSTDYQLGYRYSVPFGGFETCLSGNPLAKENFDEDPNSWPHECPHGYTRYFGGVEHGCDINICVKSGALKSSSYNTLLPPRLPPFHVHPLYELNDTDSLTFLGSDGNVWTRNWLGEWSNAEPAPQCSADTLSTTSSQEMHTIQTGSSVYTTPDQTTHAESTTQTSESKPLKKDNGLSTVTITLPTVFFGLLILCVIAIAVVLVYRAYKRHHGYNNIRRPDNLNAPA